MSEPAVNPLADAASELDTPSTTITDVKDVPDFVDLVLGDLPDADTPEPAAPAPPEAPPVVDPPAPTREIADKPPGASTPEAIAKWGELREQVKTDASEIARLKEELKQRDEKIARVTELEERAKYAEEAEKELAIARVEGTREFKELVDKPMRAIEEAVTVIAQRNELDAAALLAALAERDPAKQDTKVDELTASMTEGDKRRFYRMVDDAQTILRKEEELYSRASEAKKESESRAAEEETKQTAAKRQAFETALSSVAERLKAKGIFQAGEGETIDTLFAGLVSKAKASDFNLADTSTQAYSVFAGLAFPKLAQQYATERTARLAAEKRVQELHGAAPGGGNPPSVPAARAGDDFVAEVMKAAGLG